MAKMESYPVPYRFSQNFKVPARRAYLWCTNYDPDDWQIMGKKGTRKIRRLNEDTVILRDTVVTDEGPVTKTRLVRLKGDRLAWTNTHIGGPNKYSQFWYQIVPKGKEGSRLDFTGLQINYGNRPNSKAIAAIARDLRKDDSGMWALLSKAMSGEA